VKKLFACFLALSLSAYAEQTRHFGEVLLEWSAANSPEVEEVHVFYGQHAGHPDGFISVPASSTRALVSNLEIGELYYFSAATFSKSLGESDRCPEVRVVLPKNPRPRQPMQIEGFKVYEVDNETQ
jgi:hypothetical protein